MTAPPVAQQIAVAVVHDAERQQWLVGLRPAGGPLAGYWEFPGGKVHDGETPAEAACRECREEAGLAVSVEELLCEVEHLYDHGLLRLSFYRCVPENLAEIPRGAFRWRPSAEVRGLRFPPANQAVLERLFGGEPQ